MKKVCIIVLIVLLIIAICYLGNKYLKNEYNPKFYKEEVTYENLKDTVINIDNLNVSIKKVSFDGLNKEKISDLNLTEDDINKIMKLSEDSDFNLLLEVSTKDKTNFLELAFKYIVYDNKENFLTSNILLLTNDGMNSYQFFNKFIKESNDIDKFIEAKMERNIQKVIIRDDLNSILYLITAKKNEDVLQDDVDLSKVHILLVGPSYMNSEGEKVEMYDKVFEFIVEE